ncbi:MAG: helix-turn-helix domain-containing protein [Pseudomonadota bacterium]|uniref:XRE family transcriptional regulator n=1 Tax=Alteromonas alba TaxID=2079529 RepID=A0A2S9V911_9ALTE|nr:helix-turn-helix domain-containing protein [Alteromonas alba]MDY6929685.1 helix-turn-helix domain-containing protein [Pseudomonadota bacterium]PRO72913.1 XRE family transcriptional regulator [Alteromonas alba]RPH19814.1 MAG: helix-turn-helix domain-containing protein [Alteromonadaceae bacterium TMED7]
MEIDALQIKALRQQHQWTQQQLAELCGVSLRTIQRVEKEGNAATETVMSLSAVFEVPQRSLLVVPKADSSSWQSINIGKQTLSVLLALLIGILTGGALMYWLLSA